MDSASLQDMDSAIQEDKSADVIEYGNQVLHIIRVHNKEHIAVIVGQDGKTVCGIKERTGAQIKMNHESACIEIRGCKEAVTKAKTEIEDILQKLDNAIYRYIEIDSLLHNVMIGVNGSIIEKLKDEFTYISISFPGDGSNQVTVVGAPEDVELCCQKLKKLESEVKRSNKINTNLIVEEGLLPKVMDSPQFKELTYKFSKVRLEYPRPGQPYITLRGYYNDVVPCYNYMKSIYDNLKRQATGENQNSPLNFYQERTDVDGQPSDDTEDPGATANPASQDQRPDTEGDDSIPPEQLLNLQGTVVSVRRHRSDGFICPLQPLPGSFSKTKDVWFVLDVVNGGSYDTISKGDRVEFDLGIKEKLQPMAIAVRLL